jgi:glutamine synthetase type III
MDEKMMDFIKTLQSYHITYLPELPSKDVKVEENTVIAVPGKKQGQFIVYTWFENEWVLTSTIDKSDFKLKELKEAHNDLNNAVKKLTKIAADAEDEELFTKLSKITTKIFRAMNELSDDVIDPLEGLKSEERK